MNFYIWRAAPIGRRFNFLYTRKIDIFRIFNLAFHYYLIRCSFIVYLLYSMKAQKVIQNNKRLSKNRSITVARLGEN